MSSMTSQSSSSSRAYLVADVDVTDPDGYERYKQLSSAAVDLYGGRFLVRGGPVEVLEGEVEPHRLVVIEFDSAEAVHRWYHSPEYAQARGVRQATSTGWFVVVEGAAQPLP